jgi:hypothetical protein
MGSKRSGQSFVLRFETDRRGVPSMRITTEYPREVYLVLKELQIRSAAGRRSLSFVRRLAHLSVPAKGRPRRL